MNNHCMRHFEEPVAALCKTCQRPFCDRCLVYSFGPKKPPYCVGCALSASGVRAAKVPVAARLAVEDRVGVPGEAGVAAVDRRLQRAERRAAKSASRSAGKSTRSGRRLRGKAAGASASPPAEERSDHVPAPGSLTPASRFSSGAPQHA